MNSFFFGRLYLENFKTVSKAIIDFKGKNLSVLDGPNGFGKTTVFDAIELVLTGEIRRISSNKIATTNRGYSDHLLSKDQSKQTLIKLELISSDGSVFILARRLDPSNLSSSQKRPGEFGGFKLHALNEFNEELSEDTPEVSAKDIELLDLEKVAENFILYHYVEQEESGHFFKQSEKDRMNAISSLFNIEEEMQQKSFMEKARGRLVRQRNDISKIIGQEDTSNVESKKTEMHQIPYFPLVPDEKIQFNWDKESIPNLSKELKEEFLKELDKLRLLIENFTDFKIEQKNKELENVSNNEEKLKALIIFSHFSDELEELEKRFEEQEELKKILEILSNKQILKNNVKWSLVQSKVENLPINEITARISSLKVIYNNASNMSKIIQQMNSSRDMLRDKFLEYVINNSSDSYCPFCGSEKESIEELLADIETKTNELKLELDGSSKKVTDEIEKLYSDYLNNAIEIIQGVLHPANIIGKEFLEQLRSVSKVISDFKKAKEWFEDNEIDIDHYINKNKEVVGDVEERISNLKKDILNGKQYISDVCRNNIDDFQRLYKDKFQRKDNLIKSIALDNIDRKKNYLEYIYYMQMNTAYLRLQSYRKKLELIEQAISSIDRIIKVYNNEINTYRRKLISDIEIPFFIYSGKIIQTHQRGIGVFIKEEKSSSDEAEENQLKAINFIPQARTDHDIVHSFSSGQLASAVIAFTLSLHRVYSREGIKILLIDDPVQTMDEMNMVSLVELLRNDFSDRQIILSTHEDKVSLYLRYKFLKYGYSVCNINVKDEFYKME